MLGRDRLASTLLAMQTGVGMPRAYCRLIGVVRRIRDDGGSLRHIRDHALAHLRVAHLLQLAFDGRGFA